MTMSPLSAIAGNPTGPGLTLPAARAGISGREEEFSEHAGHFSSKETKCLHEINRVPCGAQPEQESETIGPSAASRMSFSWELPSLLAIAPSGAMVSSAGKDIVRAVDDKAGKPDGPAGEDLQAIGLGEVPLQFVAQLQDQSSQPRLEADEKARPLVSQGAGPETGTEFVRDASEAGRAPGLPLSERITGQTKSRKSSEPVMQFPDLHEIGSAPLRATRQNAVVGDDVTLTRRSQGLIGARSETHLPPAHVKAPPYHFGGFELLDGPAMSTPVDAGADIEAAGTPTSKSVQELAAPSDKAIAFQQVMRAVLETAKPLQAAEIVPGGASDLRTNDVSRNEMVVRRTMTFNLRPADLGSIDVRLTMSGDDVRVLLRFSQKETATRIGAERAALLESLKSAGLAVEGVIIELIRQADSVRASPENGATFGTGRAGGEGAGTSPDRQRDDQRFSGNPAREGNGFAPKSRQDAPGDNLAISGGALYV